MSGIEYSAPSWNTADAPTYGAGGVSGPPDSPVVIRSLMVGESPVPLPIGTGWVPIGDRVGLDLFPVDVSDTDAVRWLEACVFPDRVDRMARLRAAVALVRQAPPRVEQGDAVGDLAQVAATLGGAGPLVVFHSWALTYIDDAEGFGREVAALSGDRDVWWLAVEPSTAVPGLVVPPRGERYRAEMSAHTVTSLMHVRPHSREDRVLARSHPHLDWIHWLIP